MTPEIISQIENLENVFSLYRQQKDAVNSKIALELVKEYTAGQSSHFCAGFRRWVTVVYKELYSSPDKKNRIGVLGGDFFEEIAYCLVSIFLKTVYDGKGLIVTRELKVPTLSGKKKRMDLVIKREDEIPAVSIELKSALDKPMLLASYRDFKSIQGFKRQRYICLGASLYTRQGETISSIVGETQDQRWAYVLPEPDNINDNSSVYRGKEEGFGSLFEMFQDIDKTLRQPSTFK